jgi:hypothetical protein
VDFAMQPHDYNRQLILKIGDGRKPKSVRKLAWHESMGSLMLGALSTSLGCAVLGSVLTRSPSFDILVTAYVGQCLGMGGIYLSRRMNRGQAPLSILGTLLCLLPLAPFYLALFTIMVIFMGLVFLFLYGIDVMEH